MKSFSFAASEEFLGSGADAGAGGIGVSADGDLRRWWKGALKAFWSRDDNEVGGDMVSE